MVEIRDRQILIDGKPRLVFAGEVHYFRLEPRDWEDRVLKAKAAGCNAIASYIPWLVHEPRRGDFRLQPVADFIDLCHRHGLWFIARPGPFVMAEMKNEGIPYWVARNHPEVVPVSWEGKRAESKSLDVLHPDFLAAAERWYAAVMPILASRLQAKGGPVIAVQLDNEVGMLNWVTNQPVLTDRALRDFRAWLGPRAMHYPDGIGPWLRSPTEEVGAAFLQDLGDFERHEIARYIATLRGYAERHGVKDVPFLVNIHGTGSGRLYGLPVGIHQLVDAYTQAPGYLSGSDHYFGEITRENGQDVYLMNAFMAAVHRPEQPLTSLEFEVGSGDYGETGAQHQSGASADMKIRLSIAQGNRLLNYYLLAGGTNPPLVDPVGDGNDRVAFTGERHGFAAPISPEGALTPQYRALAESTRRLASLADKLAVAEEEHDGLALGLVLDYYKTSFRRPGPMQAIVEDLERARGPLERIARTLLFLGYRFPALNLQRGSIDPAETPALVFSSGSHLDAEIQRKLVRYVEAGGRLMLVGDFPSLDMQGRPCRILAEALDVKPGAIRSATGDFHPSLVGAGIWAGEPEVRTWRYRAFEEAGADVFLRTKHDGAAVGLFRRDSQVMILSTEYPHHRSAFQRLLKEWGVEPSLWDAGENDGILRTTMVTRDGERFLTVANLDHEKKSLRLSLGPEALFDGRSLELGPRDSRVLPLGVRMGETFVEWSTNEVFLDGAKARVAREHRVGFAAVRRGGRREVIRIEAGEGTTVL